MQSEKMQSLIEKGQKYLMNNYARMPVVMQKGVGSYVYDENGKEYLDFLGGIGVNAFGHSHTDIVETIKKQASQLIHCSNYFWTIPQIDLAKILVDNSCTDKVFFCNSGAEANEGAIKLARIYASKKFSDKKNKIISLTNSFHGRTLATLTCTGQASHHKYFSPLPEGFDYTPINDLQVLKTILDKTVCGIIVEPIQGEGGINILSEKFFDGLAKLCHERDILLIADEIQSGMGRTGKLFAYQNYNVSPDIITCAKALGSGLPIGAILAKKSVAQAFSPGDHGSTFGGNPLACKVAQQTIRKILKPGFLKEVQENGNYFINSLKKIPSPLIKEVRGIGMMIGVELQQPKAKQIMKKGVEQGLLFCTCAEKTIRFLPALNTDKKAIDKAVDILKNLTKINLSNTT